MPIALHDIGQGVGVSVIASSHVLARYGDAAEKIRRTLSGRPRRWAAISTCRSPTPSNKSLYPLSAQPSIPVLRFFLQRTSGWRRQRRLYSTDPTDAEWQSIEPREEAEKWV